MVTLCPPAMIHHLQCSCTCLVGVLLLLCGESRCTHLACLALLQAEIKTELRARSQQVALAGAASLVMMTHAQEFQEQVLVTCYFVHVYLICSLVCAYRLVKQQLVFILSCRG